MNSKIAKDLKVVALSCIFLALARTTLSVRMIPSVRASTAKTRNSMRHRALQRAELDTQNRNTRGAFNEISTAPSSCWECHKSEVRVG